MGIYARRGKNGITWYISYYFNNQQIREKVGREADGVTKKSAEKALMSRQGDVVQGRFKLEKTIKPIGFNKFIKTYLEYSRTNRYESSFQRDICSFKNLQTCFGNKHLRDITPWLVEKYKAKRKKKVKPATVNRELWTLKNILKKAVEWGKLKSNPIENVKPLKVQNVRLRFLMGEEISRLIEACAPHLKPIVIVALNTGMRRGEIFNMRWDQVNFPAGVIHIERSKNGERREIPMNEYLVNTLQEMDRSGEYVFPSKNGLPFNNVKRSYRRALNDTGITNFRFHDLRHTFASNLVMAGIDLATVQDLMGHKSIQMTMRYAHLSPGHRQKAVSILSAYYSNNHKLSTNPETSEKVVKLTT